MRRSCRIWNLASLVGAFQLSCDVNALSLHKRSPFRSKVAPRNLQLSPADSNPRLVSPPQAVSLLEDFATATSIWDYLQDIFYPIFQTIPGQHLTLSALISISFWTKITASLQRMGEVSFLTLLVVALLQGGLAVFQYRTNPSGELMVPPGLTVGEELPYNETQPKQEQHREFSSSSLASTIRSGAQTNSTEATTTLLERLSEQQTANDNQQKNRYSSFIQRINRMLVVLVPWLAGYANFILQRNAHLLHIGSILTLTSIFDVPQSFIKNYQRNWLKSGRDLFDETMDQTALTFACGNQENVVVIGDSLAVGLGSVDQFDKNKTNDIPFCRIENVGDLADTNQKEAAEGPAFPKSLAHTIAQKLKKPVMWRSAGVDGGAISHIREYCLGVIEEEVKAGRIPDVVVILCGANDMKYCVSNPFQRSNWPRAFRSKLTKLIQDIQSLAPGVTIVLPSIPAQMFHKNSPLNVFPLGLMLDTVVGFWDSQKKFVADSFDSQGVQYVGLSPREVSRWYDEPSEPQGPSVTLFAKDGVHPNAQCYSKWAEAIGIQLTQQQTSSKANRDSSAESKESDAVEA